MHNLYKNKLYSYKIFRMHTNNFVHIQYILYTYKYANLLDKISLLTMYKKMYTLVHIQYILKMCNLFWTHSICFVWVQTTNVFLQADKLDIKYFLTCKIDVKSKTLVIICLMPLCQVHMKDIKKTFYTVNKWMKNKPCAKFTVWNFTTINLLASERNRTARDRCAALN